MQQQLSVVTLGIADLIRSRRFYCDGFGWTSVFQNEEIVFYQMNGFVLGTWLSKALEDDMMRPLARPGAFALAHNVGTAEEVRAVLDRLSRYGGRILRPADAPAWGPARLRGRPGRPRLGDRVEPGLAHQPGGLRAVRAGLTPVPLFPLAGRGEDPTPLPRLGSRGAGPARARGR